MKELVKYCFVLFLIVESVFLIKIGKIPVPSFLKNIANSNRMLDGDTIFIQGFGMYNDRVLFQAKQIIDETYGLPTKIIDPIQLTSESYLKNAIDGDKCLIKFDDNKNKLLLTNENCYSEHNKTFVKGLSESNGNIAIVNEIKYKGLKQVIIHEIGHTSGLEHCENKYCVMSILGTVDERTIYFCDKCKTNNSVYELHKRYIKSLFNKTNF